MPWSTLFEDPIALPNGRELLTLEDAANYIMKLKKAERDLEHWKFAGSILIRAAEGREPLMHARIAMLQAIHHDRPASPPVSRKKPATAYKIVRSIKGDRR